MSPAALEPVFPDLCLRDDMPPRLVQQTKRLVDARGFRGTWGGGRGGRNRAGKSESGYLSSRGERIARCSPLPHREGRERGKGIPHVSLRLHD